MARQPVRLTYADYLRLPPDRRWEIVEGVPHVAPSPNIRHQEIAGRLFVLIANHLREHGGGRVFIAPLDTVLSDIDIVQPDVVFISDTDQDVLTDDNISGSPTWVIEVLSNPYYERDKLRRYEAAGVGEHWLVNPYEDTLEVRVLERAMYRRTDAYSPPALGPPAIAARPARRPQLRPAALSSRRMTRCGR
jgi:Uma2 family endonuclease